MFVVNRMTANPVTVSSTTSVTEAFELLKKYGFRRLPVVDIGKLVGIITDRDLREVSPSKATTLSIYELNYLVSKMQVKDAMTKNVVTIRDDATIEEAALLMYKHKIGGLVVLDKNDAVVGVITETDIFKCFVDVMGIAAGKTRLTLKPYPNKVGILHDITGIMAEMGINIDSMVTYCVSEDECELVVRAEIPDVKTLTDKLNAKGYTVTHIAQIGVL